MEKLVRDRIPEIMHRSGHLAKVRKAAKEERLQWLLRKLFEETIELKESTNLEECADVFEVLKTICEELGYSIDELVKAAKNKMIERGGFSAGYILEIED